MTLAADAIELPSGQMMPVLGQGTWYLGEGPASGGTSRSPRCDSGSTSA